MKSILKREIGSYFTTMIGYIFVGLILLTCGIFTYIYCFKYGSPDFQYVINYVQIVFFLAIPVLTMRSLAEERYQKTDQLLFSLPLKVSQIILGKFFSMVTILAIPTAIMCLIPPVLSLYGTISFFTAYSSIIGFFLLGCTLISIGMFISSISESQIIAAVVSFFLMLLLLVLNTLTSLVPDTAVASMVAFAIIILLFAILLYVMTKSFLISSAVGIALECVLAFVYYKFQTVFEGLFKNIIDKISLYDRSYSFFEGLFSIKTVIFYIGIIVIFLFLTTQSVEKRRWS